MWLPSWATSGGQSVRRGGEAEEAEEGGVGEEKGGVVVEVGRGALVLVAGEGAVAERIMRRHSEAEVQERQLGGMGVSVCLEGGRGTGKEGVVRFAIFAEDNAFRELFGLFVGREYGLAGGLGLWVGGGAFEVLGEELVHDAEGGIVERVEGLGSKNGAGVGEL